MEVEGLLLIKLNEIYQVTLEDLSKVTRFLFLSKSYKNIQILITEFANWRTPRVVLL